MKVANKIRRAWMAAEMRSPIASTFATDYRQSLDVSLLDAAVSEVAAALLSLFESVDEADGASTVPALDLFLLSVT